MPSPSVSQRLYYLALYLTAFVIPFPFIFAPLAILLLSAAWLLNFNLQAVLEKLKERKVIWLWAAFYLLQFLSYFYSIDKQSALQDLQTKMSFVVLPLIIGTGLPLNTEKMEKVFSAFISGLFIMAIYFLVHAFCLWCQTADTNVFFYHNLIHGVGANAVYYSLYVFLGLTMLLFFPWATSFPAKTQAFYTVLSILLVFFILLSSKLMLLLFGGLALPVYVKKILKTKKIIGYASIVTVIFISCVILFTHNPISKRFHDVLDNTDKKEWLPEYANTQKQHFNNLTLRLFLWKTAIQNIRENNLWWKGCGEGSIETLQKKKIISYGASNALIAAASPPLWKYNIHNMYLQALMMLGMPGLLVFLCLLIFPFFLLKYIENKATYVLFNISALFFMFQESALQTQAGVVFYVFFFCVFYGYAIYKKSNKNEVVLPPAIEDNVKIKINPIIYIAIVVVVAYWQVSFLRHFLLWDSIDFSYPFRFYASECIRSGHLPLWLPYQSTGYPFYADPQSGCWYPITWIFSIFGRYTLVSSDMEYILNIFIGGCGIYYLAKVWVKNKSAALLAAFCYTCCGLFVGNAEHTTWVISAAWLPWLFWSYHQMVFRLESRYAAFIAILVYLIASGGYLAFLIISFYLFIILFIVLAFNAEFRRNWKKLMLLHVALIVLSLGNCSILLYSFTQGLHSCTRNGGVSLEMALLYPFSPACFSSFLLPFSSIRAFEIYKIDRSMANGYFGLVGFIFFIFGFFQKKDKRYWLILTISLLCLMAGVGDALPVRAFLYKWVPLMNVFRFPSIFRIFFIMGFLLIGAAAFRNLKNDFTKWRKHFIAIIIALLVFYVMAVLRFSDRSITSGIDWRNYIFGSQFIKHATYAQTIFIQSLIQILILLALLSAIIFKMKQRLNIRIIFIICAIDLIIAVQLNMYGTIVYFNLLGVTKKNIDHCPKGFPTPDNNTPVDKNFDSRFWWELDPIAGNTLLFKKVLGIDGYNPFILKIFDQFEKSKLKDSVWKNPPAYFANNINLLNNDSSLQHPNDVCLNDTDFNKINGSVYPRNDSDSVYFTAFGPNKMVLHTHASSARLMVLQQNNVDDWHVKIDGKGSVWYHVNITYIGVIVPSGIHKVEYEFRPAKVLQIWILTLFFLLTCFVIITYHSINKIYLLKFSVSKILSKFI